MRIDILGLLSTDGYVMANKKVIRELGAECAIILGELCSRQAYFEKTGNLTADGFFYALQDDIEQQTGLNSYAQRNAVSTLTRAGILFVEKRGLPARNYYRIDEDKLCEFFTISNENPKSLKNCTPRCSNFKEQGVQNPEDYIIITNNKNKNNKNKNTTYFVSSPDEPVGSCNSEAQQTEDYNDGDVLEPNKNKIGADDVESRGYSKEELKEEFLQSRRKKSTKCKSLFHKCLDEIDSYTDDGKLRQALIDYLTMRLAVKDKPLRGVNQWKGMLNKLSTISGDKLQIVRHCIERGWLSFFPISNGFRDDPSKFGETESVRSEEVPDNWREIERAKAEKLGRRTSF